MLSPGATVMVAMSGGVDSSLTAAFLQEQGYRVIGAHMRLWREDDRGTEEPPAAAMAAAVAGRLSIPLHVLDLRAPFKRDVVDYLVAEYARGRTPNPCLACNRAFKFGRLLEEAHRLGADGLATGHYVRTAHQDGRYRLLRGVDRGKDQSYVLYMLGQAELAQVVFPLGELTKGAVRRLAAERGLPAAEQPESQEICFISDDDYRRFLRDVAPGTLQPGPILDRAGHELARHDGLAFYTIGQRKGLGIAAAEPLYVLSLVPARNAVIVGPASELGQDVAVVEDVRYVAGAAPTGAFRATAKIRYRAAEAEVEVTPEGPGGARVRFDRPQRDITPGQGLVIYAGDEVLGGGIIASTAAQD